MGQPFPKRLPQTPAFGGELDPLDSPVLRMRLAANSTHRLQAIDHAGQVRSVVLQLARKRSHRHRPVGRQLQQHLGLHCGELMLRSELREMRFETGLHLEPESNHLALQTQVLLPALLALGHRLRSIVVLYQYLARASGLAHCRSLRRAYLPLQRISRQVTLELADYKPPQTPALTAHGTGDVRG